MYHYGIMREKVIQRSNGAGSPIRVKSGEKDIQTIESVCILRNFTVKEMHYLEGEEGSRSFVFFFFLRF